MQTIYLQQRKNKIQNLKDTGYWRHMHIASTIWKCFNKKSKENCAAGAVTCADTAEAALKSKAAVVGTLKSRTSWWIAQNNDKKSSKV